jgi:hypothetical protein
MAIAYFEIEEYIWLDETIQGNVNVGGLVYDDLIEETLDLGPEEVLTVYSDVLLETLDFADDPRRVGGQHWTEIYDTIDIQERFGVPLRVRQSVLNLIMTTPVTPALIAHVHMDVLHGVDVYWEEVSDELQCHSSYANAVPYYWEWIYESFDIDMTEPQPLPPIYLRLYLNSNDLVNMRHEVVQEYLFNSKCFEELFIWDAVVWGWIKTNAEELGIAETVQEIIGKVADDYLYLEDHEVLWLKVWHYLADRVFIFDAADTEKYYLLVADEALVIEDGEVSYIAGDTVIEALRFGDVSASHGYFTGLATESLVFADIASFVHEIILEEGIEFGDVELTRWVYQVLAAEGFDLADIIS